MCATQISEKNKQKAIYLMLFFIYKYFFNKPATEIHNPFVLRGKLFISACHRTKLCLAYFSQTVCKIILHLSGCTTKSYHIKYYRFKIFCKDVFLSFPPTGAVQIPITDGFSYMSRPDILLPLQIGNRTGHTQDTIVSTCRKLKPRHGGT